MAKQFKQVLRARTAPLLLLFVVSAGFCQSSDPELNRAIDTFYASIESGDPEPRIALLADDVIMMPNHWTLSSGSETVARSYRSGRDSGMALKIRDREILQMEMSGGIAYTVNCYYYAYYPVNEEPQWHQTKNVHIWRRQQDSSWRLAVDIWNSDVPLELFGEE